jgi:AraC family L-rhamnose operon regulatory protein RhaS
MEIVLVEEGHLEWAVDGVPEVLDPGMVFFTLPWQVHGSQHVLEPRNRIRYVLFSLGGSYETPSDSICMPAEWGFISAEEKQLSDVLISAPRHAWPASRLLITLFRDLTRRLDDDSPLAASVARCLLRSLVVELADIINKAPQSRHLDSPSRRRVRHFLNELCHMLDQPWNLDTMARCCGMKRTRFASVVKMLTGYPPAQYLNRIRLEKACAMLRSSHMSVTEIAFECGYNSSQYFSETFRRNVRMSPSEYRRIQPERGAVIADHWSHPEHRSILEEKRRAALFKAKAEGGG